MTYTQSLYSKNYGEKTNLGEKKLTMGGGTIFFFKKILKENNFNLNENN